MFGISFLYWTQITKCLLGWKRCHGGVCIFFSSARSIFILVIFHTYCIGLYVLLNLVDQKAASNYDKCPRYCNNTTIEIASENIYSPRVQILLGAWDRTIAVDHMTSPVMIFRTFSFIYCYGMHIIGIDVFSRWIKIIYRPIFSWSFQRQLLT